MSQMTLLVQYNSKITNPDTNKDIHVHVYREKSIPMIALWCPACSNHSWLYHAWNTTAYYNYYLIIYFPYLLKDLVEL